MAKLDLLPAAGSSAWKYGKPAVLLHWAIALLIASLLGLGWYMMAIEDDPGSQWYFDLHKSLGLLVLGLVVLRILWRLTHRPAPLPAQLPRWQVRLSQLTQGALYLAMLAMPVLGLLGASYSKQGLAFFGLAVPAWAIPNHDTAEQFFDLHGTLAWVLVALIVVHAVGGLKHLLVNKDGVFQRMWW